MSSPVVHVLLVPRHPTSWVKMLEIGCLLAKRRDVKATLIIPDKSLTELAAAVDVEGLNILNISSMHVSAVRRCRGWGQIFERWVTQNLAPFDRIINSMPLSFLRFLAMRRRLKQEYKVFRAVLAQNQAGVLVVPGDREMAPVPALLAAARDMGLPAVIGASSSPYTEGVALSREGYPRFSLSLKDWPPFLNFLAARLFPGQVLMSRNGPILFSPAWLIFAHASLDMLSKNPWVQGGGFSTHVLQHSRRRMQAFLDLGVDPDKLVPIGDQSLDRLYTGYLERERLRATLCRTYSLAHDKQLIIVAVPNDAEHGVCDMKSHQSRMAVYFEILGRVSGNVLLCLHPKSDPASYRSLAEEHGLCISDTPLVETLPGADLFVCSGSSTVLWAQLCALPTINLDYWRARDADFQDVIGIENVESPQQFEVCLQRYVAGDATDPLFTDHVEMMRKDCFFDGKAGDRIGDFLVALGERNIGRATSATIRKLKPSLEATTASGAVGR